jgi:hypothetical protein
LAGSENKETQRLKKLKVYRDDSGRSYSLKFVSALEQVAVFSFAALKGAPVLENVICNGLTLKKSKISGKAVVGSRKLTIKDSIVNEITFNRKEVKIKDSKILRF